MSDACTCMGGEAPCVPPFGTSGGCSLSDDAPRPTCGRWLDQIVAVSAPVERVTFEELHAALDSAAREQMGMSADEFIVSLKAGDLDPCSPTVARLAILARLIR